MPEQISIILTPFYSTMTALQHITKHKVPIAGSSLQYDGLVDEHRGLSNGFQ